MMFRKPHTFVVLLIGLLVGAFAYAFFTSPKTSQRAEFLLKGRERSFFLNFVSVSEHKGKSAPISTHRSGSKEPKKPKRKLPLMDGEKKAAKRANSSVISPIEDQNLGKEETDKGQAQEEYEASSYQTAKPSEADENNIIQEGSSPDTDIKESDSLSSSDEGLGKKQPYLEGLRKSDSVPSFSDQELLSSTKEGVEAEVGQSSAASSIGASFYSNPQNDPEIILVIEGLGRRQETLELALDLPEGVTLAFHSFEGVERVGSKIRSDGHETLLMLPMEPLDYPENDPGPTTLLTGLASSENVARLKIHLANCPSCIGVTPFLGSRFLVSKKDLQPIFKTLKKQNLFFIEIFQTSKSVAHKVAKKEALPFQRIENRLDQTLTQVAILEGLAALEEKAKKEGQAFAVAQDIPIVLRLVAAWSKTLPEKKIRLAPLSSCFTKKNEIS